MPAIPHIKKKIGNAYLIWFQNTNSFVQLEETAWYVFRKTIQRYRPATLAKNFAIRYDISPENSLSYVNEILSEIEKLNHIIPAKNETGHIPDKLKGYQFKPYSIHHYRFGNKVVPFVFETRNFEYYIHPLISHLEVESTVTEIPLFELFAFNGRIVFRQGGEIKGMWSYDETQFVKGKIFMQLINVMHNKTDAEWLMTVHASAITNQKKTILFSAPPGHGKTTMAALLQSRGYHLISDDFVPIDRNSFSAWPFPIAMSVKEGSMELLASIYPALEQKSLNYLSPEKSVRYFTSDPDFDSSKAVFPVREFVFIEYNTSVDFEWEKLDTATAIKLLLDQAWIVPMPDNAGILLEQIPRISFFKLTYSDNEKAIKAITDLFEHESLMNDGSQIRINKIHE